MSHGGSTKPANAPAAAKAITSGVAAADGITIAAANHRTVVAALRGGYCVPLFSYQRIACAIIPKLN